MNRPIAASHTRLIMIRHGVTTWNSERRFQGQIDIPLSPEGEQQVQLLGQRFQADGPVHALYSSDLRRTWQTAEPIAAATGLPVLPEPGLRERAFGAFEGLTLEEILRDHEEPYRRWRARELDYAVPGGGEPLRLFFERVSGTMQRIANRHPGQRIVLVTHGGVLDCAYRATGTLALTDPQRPDIHNTSVNVIDWADGRFELRSWGDLSHLTL